MLIRKALVAIALGGAVGAAHGQTAPSPADVGIVKQSPNIFKLLDTSKTWTPFGSVNENTHIFSPATNGSIPTGNCVKWGPGIQDAGVSCGTGTGVPAFSEADILVTDPAVGMVANDGTDNSVFVDALMNKQMPPAWGGYDVLFPAVPGQAITAYYFSQPFVNRRTGNYHCSGSVGYLATYLIFAAGVDGFVQESNTYNADNGVGGGIISSCYIVSLGYGAAAVNTNTPTKLTGVGFAPLPGVPGLPAQSWHVGDGLVLTTNRNGFYTTASIFPVPIGTTITAVDGTTGDLTLSNPVTQSLGHIYQTKATATFTQTGTNNFVEGDTIHVGPNTYYFSAYLNGPGNVLIGANFAASAANLVAAIMATTGQFKTYYPWNSGEGAFAPDLLVSAAYASGVITFTSRYGPPDANTYPSVYTAAGASAGAFSGATFSGADGFTAANMVFYQLPKTQEFKVQTTIGSSTVTVVSGPRLLKGGDVIWSDAFRFGATVNTVSGTIGAQTATITDAANTASGTTALATVTHAPGAEGDLWILPAGIKRRTSANASNNSIINWPIGLQMSCSSNGGNNCDLSRDEANSHDLNFVGRWVAGNNTATASSKDDQFSNNYLMDIWEGGTLGEIYYNVNAESVESSYSKFSIIKNCGNQNESTIFGGYVGGGPGCTFDEFNFPPSNSGGVAIFAALSGSAGGAFVNVGNNFGNGINIIGGHDNAQCVALNGPANAWWAIAFSFAGCNNTTAQLAMSWNGAGVWGWTMEGPAGETVMSFLNTDWGFTGYAGPTGKAVALGYGIILSDIDSYSNSNLLSMSANPGAPVATPRQSGDVVINTSLTAGGGAAAWYDAGGTWYPAAQIANDAAGTSWPVATPVVISSLAACSATTVGFGVVINGVAVGTGGYGTAVSATGAATRPVFCDGTSWTYH